MKLIRLCLLFLLLVIFGNHDLGAQNIITIAGNGTSGYSGDGGVATAAEMNSPYGVAVDGIGNVYIADQGNNCVRKVNNSGTITTLAGNGTSGYSGDGGPGTAGELNSPSGVACDGSGNVYIADMNNHVIRKVNSSGTISTFAGNGTAGYSGDGGAAGACELQHPTAVATDASGNVYIADKDNQRIRKVSGGTITTVGGTGTAGFSGDEGAATAAMIYNPTALVCDASGNIYINDETNVRIRKIDGSGVIHTIAGNGTDGYTGDGGAATAAELNEAYGVCVDGMGNVYISDLVNERIRMVNTSGTINTICGSGVRGNSGDGGPATAAELYNPTGICSDGSGNLYIADNINNSCRKISPQGSIISGTTTICVGSNATLSDAVSGGTWSSSNTSVATVGSSTGVVSGVSAGSAVISYSFSGTATIGVTIVSSPSAGSITGTASVCIGSTTNLADAVPGGVWTSSNPATGTVSSSGVVTGIAAGSTIISYTVSNSCGTAITSRTVTAGSAPSVAAISGGSSVCAGSNLSLTDVTGAGVWSSSNPSVGSISSGGTVTGLSAGSTIISYSVANSCGTTNSLQNIVVNGLPSPSFSASPSGTMCSGTSATYTTQSGESNYVWSVPGVSGTDYLITFGGIGTSSTTVTLLWLTTGSKTVTVNFTDGNGCTGSAASSTTVVGSSPSVAVITGTTSVCSGSATTLSDATGSGAWSSTNTAVGSVNSGGVVTGISGGTTTVSYTVTNSCGTAASTAVVTVGTGPSVAAITGTMSVCAGLSATLSDATTGGAWSSSDISVGTIDASGKVTGISAGTTAISYSLSNSCGTTSAIAIFSVGTVPSVAALSGPTSVSVGSSISLTDVTSGGAWSSSNTAVGSVSSSGTVSGVATGSAIISYTVSNSCGSTTVTSIISVGTLPVVSAISGSSAVCLGTATTLTDATSGGVWSSSNTGVATVSSGTVTGVAAGSAIISYSLTNGYGTTTTTKAITVGSNPTASASAGTIYCFGGSTTISVSGSGGTGSLSGTGTYSVTAGTYSYTVTDAIGCSATASVTVTAPASAVTATVTAAPIACHNGTTTIVLNGAGGTGGLTLVSSSLGMTGPFSSSVTFTSVSAGTYNFVVEDVNSCSASVSITIANPSVVTASSSTPGILCHGGSAIVTVSGSGGTGTLTGVGTFTVTAGTYGYTVSDANSCTATTSVTVTNPSALSITATPGTILCNGGTTTIDVAGTGGTGAITGTGIYTVNAGTFSYTITDANLCTSSTTVTVSQPGAISMTATAGTILCHGGTTTVTVTGSGGTGTLSGTGTFTASAGSPTYTVTDANGCTVTSTVTITQPAVLTASATAGGTITCHGGMTTVIVAGSGGTGSLSGVGTFTVTAGTHNYTVTDGNGCTASASITIAEPAVISSTASVVSNVTCNGLSNGSITTSNPTGGTSPYTFSWTGGATTQTVSGLPAGSYTVTVTDAVGCTSTSVATVTQPSVVTASTTPGAILCHDGTTTLTLNGSGGTGGLTLVSSSLGSTGPFTSSVNFTGVSAGTYSFTVEDVNSCTASTSVTISNPPVLSASSSAGSISCYGGTTTVNVSGSGGTGSLSGVGTFTVSAGTHNYTITDGNGCTASTSVVVTQPSAVVTTATAGSIACFGGNTTVSVSGSGGTGTLSGVGTFTVTSGAYTYTITDANLCTGTTSVTVTQPTLLTASATAGTITCHGGATTVVVTATGGTGTLTGTGSFTAAAGTHNYTVTDANGCTAVASITLTEPGAISETVTAGSIGCFGGTTTVVVTASGGTGVLSGTGTYTVSAGVYNYTITDGSGCTTTTSVTVTQPTLLTASSIAGSILCNGGTTTINVSGSGGTGTLTGVGTFTVAAGAYSYTISDANSCTATTSVTVTQPTAIVAFSTSGSILCHGGSTTVTVTASGGTGTLTGTGHFAALAGTHTYTVTDANGCSATTSITILEPAVLGITASALPNPICLASILSLSSITSGGTSPYVSYSWVNPALASFSSAADTSINASLSGVYSVTVTDSHGCMATTGTTSVTVNPLPVITVLPAGAPNPVCAGSALNLTVTATGSGTLNYAWNGPGGYSATSQNPVIGAVTLSDMGVYSVTVTDGNLCTASGVTPVITVDGGVPVLSPILGPTTVNPGACIQLSDTALHGSWSSANPSLATVGATTGSVSGVNPGWVVITYSVTNACGTSTITKSVDVSSTWCNFDDIYTCAGQGINGYTGDGGPATAAELNTPKGICTDNSGNIYIADPVANCVRKINASGTISTFAGTGVSGFSGDGGAATTALLNSPYSVACDVDGNIYIADYGNNRVRIVNTTGIINTFAGTGTAGYSGNGGPATASELFGPFGVACDNSGNVHILNSLSDELRIVNNSGIISLECGTPGTAGYSGDGGPATIAALRGPTGVNCDVYGNVYICDEGNVRVRRINNSGIISTFAGIGVDGVSADGGLATASALMQPYDVCADACGNVYISDRGPSYRIRMVDGAGIIHTYTGNEVRLNLGDGSPATLGSITTPFGICLDASDNLFICEADPGSAYIREVAPAPLPATTGPDSVCTASNTLISDAQSGGTWASGNTSIFTVGLTTGVITGVAAGTATITYKYGSTCLSIDTVTVHQTPPAITGTFVICNLLTTTLADTSTNGMWVSSSSGVASLGSGTGVVTGVTAGTTLISYYIPTTGCYAQAPFLVNPLPLPITGNNNVCAGLSTTLSEVTTGGTWTSSNTSVASVGTGTGVVFGVSAGTAAVTFTITSTGCLTSQGVTVNPLPANVTGTNNVCRTLTTTLADVTTGGTWISGSSGIASVGSLTGIVTGVGAGITTITYKLTLTGCIATSSFTTNALPSAITGSTHVCVASTTHLFDGTSGGTWTSSNTGVATVVSGTGIVTGVSAGSAIITYTLSATGCIATTNVIVNPLPASITGTANFCKGTTSTLGDITTGGTWTSSLTSVATVVSGSGVVTGVAAGTASIIYTITSTGCASNTVVTINPLPANITGATHICVGASTTLADGTSGGTWTSNNTGVASIVAGTGVMTGVGAGTTTVTYTLTSTGCISTKQVTINALPATITGTTGICVDGSTALMETTGGGAWTSSDNSIGSVDGSGNVTGVSAGTVSITYSISGTGCMASTIVTVNITPAAIGGTAGFCGLTTALTESVTGGNWSSSNTSVVTVDASGNVTGTLAGGTATITYAMSGTCMATLQVTVNPLPADISSNSCGIISTIAATNQATGVCVDGSGNVYYADFLNNVVKKISSMGVITTIAGTGTAGYTTDGVAATTSELNNPSSVAVDGAGNVYIADFGNNRVRCVNTSGIISTITGNGTPGYTGDGGAAISAEVNTPYDVAVDGSVNIYIADNGNNVVRKISSGIISTIAGNGTGGYTGEGVATAVELNYPVGLAIDAAGNVYIGDLSNNRVRVVNTSGIISTFAGNGTAGYIGDGMLATASELDAPAGLAIDQAGNLYIADGVNSRIRVVAPNGIINTVAGDAGSGYTGDGVCATTTELYGPQGIAVDAVGNLYIADQLNNRIRMVTSTNGTVCAGGGMITLTDGTPGGTWSCSNPAIATIDGSGNVTGVSGGTPVITYTTPAGCAATDRIIVNPTPSGITGNTNFCMGAVSTLSDATGSGTWSSSDGGSVVSIDIAGNVTGVAAGTTTITYTITATGCYSTTQVTINPMPASITGNNNFCNLTTTLFDATTGGGWTSGNASVATVDGSGVVTAVAAGTTVITYSMSGTGCYATTGLTVNPFPTAISGSNNVCNTFSTLLLDGMSGGTWSGTDGGSVCTIDVGGNVTGVSAGTTTITYNVSGCYATIGFTVNPVPATISGTTTFCNLTTMLGDATSGGNWSCSDLTIATIDATGLVTAVGVGGATITYTIPASGCYASTPITVNPFPHAIAGTPKVCIGLVTDMTDAIGGGTWSVSDGTVASVDGSGDVSGIASGTTTLTYNISGCIATTQVTVNPNPAPITGSMNFCSVTSDMGETTTGGVWSSSNTGVATIDVSGEVTAVSAGTAEITYSISSTGCLAATQVTINPFPSSVTGTRSVCQGLLTALADATTGGTWTSGNTAVATIDGSGNVTGVSSGTSKITYTITLTGCTASAVVTVNALPATIGGPSALCVGTASTLTDATGGGTWTSGSTGIATIVSGTGVATGVAAGTAIITYTKTSTGCLTTAVETINSSPGGISGTTSLCAGSASTLSDGTSGGTWSCSNTSVATINSGTGVMNGVASGSATVTYTVTATGCYATAHITVNALPVAIGGTASVCVGSTNTLTDATAGGVWTSSDVTIATIGSGNGHVTGVAAGNAFITYEVGTSGCLTTKQVTVDAQPSPSFSSEPGSDICANTSVTYTTQNGESNYVWSVPGTSGTDYTITSGSTGSSSRFVTLTWLTAGTKTVTVNYSNSNGCAGATPASSTTDVHALPDVVAFTPVIADGCVGANGNVNISGSTLADGAYTVYYNLTGANVSSSNTSTLTVSSGSGTFVIPSSLLTTFGSTTLTVYSVEDAYTCASSLSKSATFNVIALPSSGAIVGANTVSPGAFITLYDTSFNGTWISSNNSIASVGAATGIVAGVTPGTAVISYSLVNICTTVVATQTVTVSSAWCTGEDIYTMAGNGENISYVYTASGVATATSMNSPKGVCVDLYGNVYIADDLANVVRKVDMSGNMTTFAGNNTAGYSGDGGAAASAELNQPKSVACDKYGNVYICDYGNNRIRVVNTSGIISTYAGNGTSGLSGNNGPATAAELAGPIGVTYDFHGNIYFIEYTNNDVRKVDASGTITLICGLPGTPGGSGYGGPATAALLREPTSIACDTNGNVYIDDEGNVQIEKITISTGIFTRVAGDGTGLDGVSGFNCTGIPATNARLFEPYDICVDIYGNLYISDRGHYVVEQVNTAGEISVYCGTPTSRGNTGDGGPATSGTITTPFGICLDGAGTLYICEADPESGYVRMVSPPAMTPMACPAPVCLYGSTTVTDAESGGTWASGNTSIFTVDNSGIVTGESVGTAQVSYSVDGCMSLCDVTVLSLPAAYNVTPSAHSADGTHVGLDGSDVGVSYQLFHDDFASPVGGADLDGTGSALDFGAENDGTYMVIATNDATGCTDTMNGSAFIGNGSRAGTGGPGITPNPSTGTFYITGPFGSPRNEEVDIDVVDMLGQKVYEAHTTTTAGKINVEVVLANNLANGMYLLTMHCPVENKLFHIMLLR